MIGEKISTSAIRDLGIEAPNLTINGPEAFVFKAILRDVEEKEPPEIPETSEEYMKTARGAYKSAVESVAVLIHLVKTEKIKPT